MQFTQEFDVDSFQFWGGAADVAAKCRKAGKLDDLGQLVEEEFAGKTPTKTQVNDFVWFGWNEIYKILGISGSEEEEED